MHREIVDPNAENTNEHLERLLLEGLESGEPIAITPEFWKELWDRIAAQSQLQLTRIQSIERP